MNAAPDDDMAPPTPAMRTLIEASAHVFGVPLLDMFSRRRDARLCFARHVAWWLARRLTLLTFAEIGVRSGGADHSTVSSGCQRVDRALKADPTLWRDVIDVQARVGRSLPDGWVEMYGVAATAAERPLKLVAAS